MKEGFLTGKVCPVATQDVHINLKNRNHAFKEYGYGPPNPNEPNEYFWLKKAKMYNAPTDAVKSLRCGNCAAFIQTPAMMECIVGGIEKGKSEYEGEYEGEDEAEYEAEDEAEDEGEYEAENEAENELSYDKQFVAAADLGYCDLFHFTCAANRTCDAWKSGGPITKE
jgi:hypothetical protein